MDLIALAVLLLVGGLLIAADYSIFRLDRQGGTLIMGDGTLWFALALTVAYFAAVIILAF